MTNYEGPLTRSGMGVAITAAVLMLAGAVSSAGSAGNETDSEQAASGAPYVPSPHSIVADMLELGGVGPSDYLIDLGSGDGRIVLTAAKVFGARGLGVEIRPDLVARSRRTAQELGVAQRASFVQQDLFETDLSEATVVTVYLLPETLERLRDKLLWELAPDTRVLSHDYPIKGWKAERVVKLEHEEKVAVTGVARTNLYLYRVPADVAGRWSASVPGRVNGEPLQLEFVQRMTIVRGRAHLGNRTVPLDEVELRGRQLSFTLPEAGARFVGQIDEGFVQGDVEIDGQRKRWQASRI